MKDHIKTTLKIAWPCILESVMASAASFVDSIMVGKLGPDATAAVAVNSSVTWLINSMSAGLAVGGTVLVARHIGAGQRNEANDTATQTVSMTLIISLLITIIVFAMGGVIPKFMGAEAKVLPDAITYLRVYSLCIFPYFTGLVVSGILRGAGNMKMPMYVIIAAIVLNIIGNGLLIYNSWTLKIFGFEFLIWGAGLGVFGAAISTSASQAIAGIILFVIILSKKGNVYVDVKKLFKFDKDIIKRVLKIGFPAAGERITMSLGQMSFQKVVSSLGTIAISANHMAMTAESITYMPVSGLSSASTTLVGQALGGDNKEDALIYSNICSWIAVLIGVIGFICLYFFPESLMKLFSSNPEVIEQGCIALRTIAVIEPCFCLSIIYVGILRGAGDTKIPFISSLVGMWGIRIISSWFLAVKMGMGIRGAWMGMGMDIMVRFFILVVRYNRKKWLNESVI